jgi:hypothetical protein
LDLGVRFRAGLAGRAKGKRVGVEDWKTEGKVKGGVWMQHRDFPGGHPSQYYSGPKALNCRVLMGSGVVALV